MKQLFVFVFLSTIAFTVSAQPVNKVYWVGPTTGANLNSVNWATTSGGNSGVYPSNFDYQLVFDGGITAGQTYVVNINTTTGGFFSVTNNTTVILQMNTAGSPFDLRSSGFSIDAGSKLIFENTGTGALLVSIHGDIRYNSTVAGKMVMKAPITTCTQFYCPQIWLNLSGFATPIPPTKSLSIPGTLRMEGTACYINSGISSYLVFEANSNFILDTDQGPEGSFTFHPTSTIIITGAGKGTSMSPTSAYFNSFNGVGNIIYDCPSQTVTRPLFSGNTWTVNGNLIIKNSGTGKLTMSSGTVVKDFILEVP